MDLGVVGLGRMGMNMVTRLCQRQHRVVTDDRARSVTERSRAAGAEPATVHSPIV